MGKVFILIAAMSFEGVASQVITPNVSDGYTCLNLRARPQGRKIKCVANGTQLKLLKRGARRNWDLVEYKGRSLWIFNPAQQNTTRFVASHRRGGKNAIKAHRAVSSTLKKTRPQGDDMFQLETEDKAPTIKNDFSGSDADFSFGKWPDEPAVKTQDRAQPKVKAIPPTVKKKIQLKKPVQTPSQFSAWPDEPIVKSDLDTKVNSKPKVDVKPLSLEPEVKPKLKPQPLVKKKTVEKKAKTNSIAQPEMEGESAEYITPNVNGGYHCLNLRSRPQGRKMGCITNGAKVKLIKSGARKNWDLVEYDGKKGYFYNPGSRNTTSFNGNSRPGVRDQSGGDGALSTDDNGDVGVGGRQLSGRDGEREGTERERSDSRPNPAGLKKIGSMVDRCSKSSVAKVKRQVGRKWVRRCAQILRHTVACVAKKMGNRKCRMDRVACSGSANKYPYGRCKSELQRCGWERVLANDSRCNKPGAVHVFGRTGTTAGRKHGHIAILDHRLRLRGNHKPIRLRSSPRSWKDKRFCYIPTSATISKAARH